MNIVNSITELYCRIDDALPDVPQHSQASPLHQRVGHHRHPPRHQEQPAPCLTRGQPPPLLRLAQRQLWRPVPQTARTHPPLPLVAWKPKPAGPATSWPNPPSWAWPTATALNWAIRRAPDGTSTKWARSASPIIAGSWAANSASLLNQLGQIVAWDCATAPIFDQ